MIAICKPIYSSVIPRTKNHHKFTVSRCSSKIYLELFEGLVGPAYGNPGGV